MKTVAVVVFLAFCGAASANQMSRGLPDKCYIPENALTQWRCPDTTASSKCSDECGGNYCRYYKTHDLPICVDSYYQKCVDNDLTPPSACADPTGGVAGGSDRVGNFGGGKSSSVFGGYYCILLWLMIYVYYATSQPYYSQLALYKLKFTSHNSS